MNIVGTARPWMIAGFLIALQISYNDTKCVFAESLKTIPSRRMERVDVDWDHSGKPTHFALSSQTPDSVNAPDTLTIQHSGIRPFILINKDGGWGRFAESSPALKRRNMVSTKRMFFIAAGPASDARMYLILIGEGSGCCVGSLTVLTPDKDGSPLTVFHESRHLLTDVRPLDDTSGIQLIAKSSDSEAWAIKNAETYDPFRVYLLRDSFPANYDLNLSKTYTRTHYCQWAGPDYNEKFGAIQVGDGAANCKIMTREQFESYEAKHVARFSQN